MVCRNLFKHLTVILELYKIVEITAALRLTAKMTQNSNKWLGAEKVFFFEHVLF